MSWRQSVAFFLGWSCFTLVGLLQPSIATAQAPDPQTGQELGEQQLLHQTTELVQRGAFNQAIAQLERLSDRGVIHPDASYNRALAYLQRYESPQRDDGDIGQVVAGLREAIVLRGQDDEADALLARVRQEISRSRSREGLDPVIVRPALGRALVGLAPENVWALLAAVGAVALSIGLGLRYFAATQLRLAGQVTAAAGGISLLIFSTLTWTAQRYRTTTQEATVVTRQARLLNDDGSTLKAKALNVEASTIPQGASVYVLALRGRLARIQWGNIDAWVNQAALRRLSYQVELQGKL